MKTRDKDFTGCHPEIAKALKQNKDVYCVVWNGNIKGKDWIIHYSQEYNKYCGKNLDYWDNAEPVNTKEIVKPFWELVDILKKDGYKPKETLNVDWFLSFVGDVPFFSRMFKFCGKKPTDEYEWKDEWLMEVEEDD